LGEPGRLAIPACSESPVTGEKHPEFTPRHHAQAWLRFSFTEQLGIGVGGRLVAKQFADQENRLAMPDYALLDAVRPC
jgi:outer membrane receptor for monomeric catechols